MKKALKRSLSLLLAITIIMGSAYVGLSEVDFDGLFAVEAKAADSKVEAAINWAIGIANDDTYGYSDGSEACGYRSRYGPDYDCSSLITTAFRNAGFNLPYDLYTGNMKKYFTEAGFTWIPASDIPGFPASCANLQRGDILLNHVHHTELYLGNGQNVGAHWDWNGISGGIGGDGPDEINVAGYHNRSNWDGVLRYEGVSTEPPVAPTVYLNKTKLKTNEIATLSWSNCDRAEYYWISCWSATEQCISEKSYGLSKEISFSTPGNYSITVVSINNKGEAIGNWINIEVYEPEPPAAPTVIIEKNILKVNEKTTLWWNACDNADFYWISCWSETEQCISEKSYELKKDISFSEPGKYSITVVSINDKAEVIGNWITIEVYDTNGYNTIAYNSNGGSGVISSHNVYYDSVFSLNKSTFTKNGYKQIGWNAYRCSDDKWYVPYIGWKTEEDINKNGWEKSVYPMSLSDWCFDFSWYNGGILNDTITFYAMWEKVVKETEKSLIDYSNAKIYTTVENCNDITEILDLSDNADVTVFASINNDIYGTGTVIIVYEGDTQVGIFDLIVNGDTNYDSVCDALDATKVALVINGHDTMGSLSKLAADSNSDDEINIEDYQAIVNKVVA